MVCSLALALVTSAPAESAPSATPPGWHLKVTSGVPELNGTFKASGGTLESDCPANHLMLAFRWHHLHMAGSVWNFGLNLANRLHPGKWKLGPAAAILQLGTRTGGEGWFAGEDGSVPWHGFVELAADLRHGTFKALLPPVRYGGFKVPANVSGTFACP